MHPAVTTLITNDADDIPVSMRSHRARGRKTRRQPAIQEQLLTPAVEKALVDHVLRLHRNGHPYCVKHLWFSLERFYSGEADQTIDAAFAYL